MCEVVLAYRLPDHGDDSVLPQVLHMLHAQKNRMSEGAGLSFYDPGSGKFGTYHTLNKLEDDPYFSGKQTFTPDFHSPFLIAHGRYVTAGALTLANAQPMQNDPGNSVILNEHHAMVATGNHRPRSQRFTMLFNGNIANKEQLRRKLKVEPIGDSDTEVLMRTIERIADEKGWPSWDKVFKELEKEIDGGCSLCLVDGNGNFIAYRNQPGITPLWFAEDNDNGILLVASETRAFENLTKNFREVPSGTMIQYDFRDELICEYATSDIKDVPARLNAAEVIYTANADSQTNGQSNATTRRLIGQGMARLMAPHIHTLSRKERGDILVIGVPNTGLPYGKGFTQGLIAEKLIPARRYPRGMKRVPVKNHSRSFMASSDEERIYRAERKHTVTAEDVAGKSVYPFDDSFVRSITSRVLTRKLWTAGAREINWVFGSSPVIGGDYYGIDIPSLEELGFWQIWRQTPLPERDHLLHRRQDGALEVNLHLFGRKVANKLLTDARHDLIASGEKVPDLIPVTATFTPLKLLEDILPGGPDHYSFHLFTGQYPTPAGQQRFNQSLKNLQKLAA